VSIPNLENLSLSRNVTHQQDVAARIAQLRREKSAREHRDVLQKEIARATGLSVVTYGRYENGERKVPDEAIIALAEYYGTTPWFIRYGVETSERPVATEVPVSPATIEALRSGRAAKAATPKPQAEPKPRLRKTAGERPRRGRPPNPK
jgi:transcriptional regulator with XRE-family HTH domain